MVRDVQSLSADSGRFEASLDTGCAVSISGQWSLLRPRLIRDAHSLAAGSGRFEASLGVGCSFSSSEQRPL